MEIKAQINNDIYHTLGERWYSAYDDPVALLRAESRLTGRWVAEKMSSHLGPTKRCEVLDIGCGGGFLSNSLAKQGHSVTAIDLSAESIEIARRFDHTKSVKYFQANAYQLPFGKHTFDVVSAMDFLEHVEDPAMVIREVERVLKPGGIFLFHTFSRNPLSWLVIIKMVEWFVRNTPKHLHVYRLFIKPHELQVYCGRAGLRLQEMRGTYPRIGPLTALTFLNGTVPKDLTFAFSNSLMLGYVGCATKY